MMGCETIYGASSAGLQRLGKHLTSAKAREEEHREWSDSRFSKQIKAGKMQQEMREYALKLRDSSIHSASAPSLEAQVSQRMREKLERELYRPSSAVDSAPRQLYLTTHQCSYR